MFHFYRRQLNSVFTESYAYLRHGLLCQVTYVIELLRLNTVDSVLLKDRSILNFLRNYI